MVGNTTTDQPRSVAPAIFPAQFDLRAFVLVALAFLVLYLPSYWALSHSVWVSDEQGHGPIILAVSFWLLYRQRHEIAAAATKPLPWLAYPFLCIALLFYAFGRSQDILLFEVGSQIFVLISIMLLFGGRGALRKAWFPLFFLLFMVPLPDVLVSSVTSPLKMAVSSVASSLMYWLGYPIGRSGVMLTVGQYQLLVADACAGLNSMFTLEALGLLYMNLMNYTSAGRNVTLALLLVPISFCANIVRVMILVMVTYHFGDEAGQGFVHGFAGMVLFMVALMLMLFVDKLLSFVFAGQRRGA
ncbi:exosortase B [Paucibacter oligotrophus]|uniref:Exosortase B n=1 Tax=Roseateles oligotrophus TaxID=1769250 RepID=A0A840L6I8_9BURK|nr:exosortase B [Roseateles oligotrophus]MBB4842302.1 exosortase B [Roseateles oligotrophus]